MFETVNDIALIILEVICFRIFYDAIFYGDSKTTKSVRYLYLGIQLLLYLLIVELFENVIWLKEIGIILVTTVIMSRLKRISIREAMAASIALLIIMFIFDLIALRLIHSRFNQFDINHIGGNMAVRFIVVIEKTITLLTVIYFKMAQDRKHGCGLVEAEMAKFTFVPFFTILASISIIVAFDDITDKRKYNVLSAISLGMVVINVIVYYLISDIINREISIKNKELEYAHFMNQINIYKMLEEKVEEQRADAHEFKNHIMCIENLVKNNDIEALKKYVIKLNSSATNQRSIIDTNNVIVNTILNEKYQDMLNKNIVFVFKINDLSKIYFEEDDLVVLLSNLLNNAIEACIRYEGEKVIKLKFICEDEDIILSVSNTFSGRINYKDGEYKTSKSENPKEHGFGMKNIKKVIAKYGGTYSITNNEKEFYFAILFPSKPSNLNIV